jgi:hypothetical protein
MDEPRDDLGKEVHRLMSAAQDWARNAFPQPAEQPGAGARTEPTEDSREATPQGRGGECVAWCPICQFAHILRGEHPEVTERLVEAGTALATAMKALADAALPRPQSAPGDGGGSDRPRPRPRVQRIRLDDPGES